MSSQSASASAAHFKAGLAALKQENYDEAIAQLRQVPKGKNFEGAQRALVVAYDRVEKFETAIPLCYKLTSSTDPKLQAWAQKSLKRLKQRARRKEMQTAEAPTVAFAHSDESPQAALAELKPAQSRPTSSKPTQSTPAQSTPAKPAQAKSTLAKSTLAKSTLAQRDSRWRSLGSMPLTLRYRLALGLLLAWGTWQLARAPFWPAALGPYVWAVLAGVGLVIGCLIFLNHRRLSRALAPLNLRAEETLMVLGWLWFLPNSLTWVFEGSERLLNHLPFVSLSLPAWTAVLLPLQGAALLLLASLPWGVSALVWLERWDQTQPQRSIWRDWKQAVRSRLPARWQGNATTEGKASAVKASSDPTPRFRQVLPLSQLETYSPDAVALMRRFFRQQRQINPAPILLFETPTPFVLSVGYLPRQRRILLSRGFLEQLDSEAIAALIAAELGHFEDHASLMLPWLMGLLQLPYGLYRLFAALGSGCQRQLQRKLDIGFRLLFRLGLLFGGGLAAAAYGLFKLWRWPLLGLARSRSRYGDRATADFLGNPDAYGRALVAYTQALTHSVQQQEKTPAFLEAWELLLPLGLPVALTTCWSDSAVSLSDRLTWDCQTPYRFWLNLNNAHPLLGERLSLLNHYAQRSNLPSSWTLPSSPSKPLNVLRAYQQQRTPSDRRRAVREALQLWPPILLQGAPFFGILAGLGLGLLVWMLGATASLFGLSALDWVLGDRTLLWGLMPIGLSLGLVLRTNSFFPQRQQRETSTAAAAVTLLPDAHRLPLNAEPVQFSGKLTGRAQVNNWLGQDLLLQTSTGPLRLHWCSPLGPAGNLWPKFLRPSFLLQREVIVSGWLRRGATLWLDVEQLQTQSGGKSSQRGHPMWAAVMAAIAAIWGCLILLRLV